MILVAKDMLTIPNPLHMGIEGKTLVFPSMGVEKGVQFHLWKSCTLRTAYKAAHLITSSLMAVKSRPPLSVISSTSMRTNVVAIGCGSGTRCISGASLKVASGLLQTSDLLSIVWTMLAKPLHND